ncbi:trehalose-phosphatase, partial [Micromonospora azadirachtae]
MPPLNMGNQQPGDLSSADDVWRANAARAAGTVLFFDFDGTLAPVGDDPTAVQPAPRVLTAIEALAPLVRRIAIVSARPVDFLRDRLGGLAGVDLYGLYGLEHSHSGGDTVTEPAALPWVPTMAELAELARAELPAGTLVEFKRLSV